jgi:hypothetical protein
MATAITAVPTSPASSAAKLGNGRPPAMLMRWLFMSDPLAYRCLMARQRHFDRAGDDASPDVATPGAKAPVIAMARQRAF